LAFGLWPLAFGFTTVPAPALAQDATVLSTVARWDLDAKAPTIVIPLAGALTEKQKNIVNGGFTTVSQLTVRFAPPNLEEGTIPDEDEGDDDAPLPPLYRIRCSVKFDAWEETYDIARLDDSPRTGVVKEFGAYATMCLTASIRLADVEARTPVQHLPRSGGTLLAYLAIKQTSPQEAARIKDWLIQQQSGVMQGLFSHMLGELTLSQLVKVRVSVPPKPDKLDDGVNVKQENERVTKPQPDKKG
jgi:hypothetical protein